MAESERDQVFASKQLDGLRYMLKASDAARLKVEGERDEARKAWRQIRSSAIRYDFTGRDLNLLRSFLMPYLESLARREYEAGYAAGHEDQMRCRIRDAQPPASPEPDPSIRGCPNCGRSAATALWGREEGCIDSVTCPNCGQQVSARLVASPEPEASKSAGHEFNNYWISYPHDFLAGATSLCDASRDDGSMCSFAQRSHLCTVCGLPWSQHGGRDGK